MKTKSSDSVACSHCLLKFNKNTAITEKNGEHYLYFCCAGCRSVYHVIRDGGFEKFYEKRRGFKPGPPGSVSVSEELFSDDITEVDGLKEIDIYVSGIRCAACIWLIENYIGKLTGVVYVRANYATHQIKIKWDRESDLSSILKTIVSLGYTPLPLSGGSKDAQLFKEKKRN